MKTYTVSLKFVRVWQEEIIANSQEQAEQIAQEMADLEDRVLDINEGECVVVAGVEEAVSV